MTDTILHFHPWIVKRTLLHEYFSRSWGMFDAAERTEESGVAAMLTGLSFELAIKALVVLVGQEPPKGKHEIAKSLAKIPELRSLLEELWDRDLDFLIQFIDEDINSSQMRYGAAGSYKQKGTELIAAATAHESTTWTAAVSELYEEIMCSIGATIWENYPEEDRNGQKVQRRIKMHPIFKAGTPKDVYPHYKTSVYGLTLLAEINGIETEYGATIPIEGMSKDGSYSVRVRIGKDTAVDQLVVQRSGLQSLSGFKWIGQPVDGVRFKLYEALSNLSNVRPNG